MFKSGQYVVHTHTGNRYKILFSPHDNDVRCAERGDKMYIYQNIESSKIIVRSAALFEDGRYEAELTNAKHPPTTHRQD